MTRPLLLDLFCGAGGAAVGYHRAGFDVVGVDLKPQPSYPFPFLQCDALEYLARFGWMYDAIHASPPCQPHSQTRHLWNARRHEDFLPQTRALLNVSGRPYIIENVPGARLLNPVTLCGVSFGLKVFRHREFESGHLLLAPTHERHDGSTGSHRGYSTERGGRNGFICVAGHNYQRDAGMRAMGIDWMKSRRELSQAIPPAYTEYLGKQLLAHLESRKAA